MNVLVLSRDEAEKLVNKYVSKRNWRLHILAVEAIMRNLAKHLGEDEELWGLTGLLHDIDFEMTEKTPERHGLEAENLLKDLVPSEVLHAIKAHNPEHTGIEPTTIMEKALIASDAVSGLVVATALVMPSKKLREVKLDTLKRKFKDKSFARGAKRNRIMLCEELGLSLDEFLGIALESLKGISEKLGL